MADEQSQTIIRLLEEIRDLTKQRIEKVDAVVDATRQKAEEAVRQHTEAQKVAKKRFYVALAAVVLLGFMFFILVLVLMMPSKYP